MTTIIPVNLSPFGHNSSKQQQKQQHQLLLLNRHFSSSKALPISKSGSSFSRSHLTFSSSGAFSISLPVLYLKDRSFGAGGGSPTSTSLFPSTSVPSVDSVKGVGTAASAELPLKASGSLPDLYTMVSGSTATPAATISPEHQNGYLRHRASSLNVTPLNANSCSTSAVIPEKVLPVVAARSKPEEPKQADPVHFLSDISPEPLSSALFRCDTQPESASADSNSGDKSDNNNNNKNSINNAQIDGSAVQEAEKVVPTTTTTTLSNEQPTRRESSSAMMNTSPASTPTPRRRKNSSMTPVLPDLELMAKLQAEDEQKQKEEMVAAATTSNGIGGDEPDAKAGNRKEDFSQQLVDHRKEWQLFGSGSEKESAAAWLAAATKRSPQTKRKNGLNGMHFGGGGGNDRGDAIPGFSTTATSCGTEVQLAAKQQQHQQSSVFSFPPVPTFTINKSSQYLPPSAAAAATRAPPAIVTTSSTATSFYSGIDSSTAEYKIPSNSSTQSPVNAPPPPSPKPLQPFGKNDRVRRTSILRPPSSFVPTPAAAVSSKKKVSFADTAGKALEIVRYFAVTPVATRRYSSYTAPTADAYLTNGNYNSPWNFAINGNTNRRPLGTATSAASRNPGCTSSATAPAFTSSHSMNAVSKEYDYSQHAKLAPRYELVACNFTSPSLQLSFGQRLETQSVLLHSVTTAETTIYGTVSVMNLHFTKRVLVRYSFNEWASYIEREATYMLGSHDGHTDKFSFVIYARPEDFDAGWGGGNLATTFTAYSQANTFVASSREAATSSHPRLYFALCFTTGDGRTFWDNNDGRNYCLNLTAY